MHSIKLIFSALILLVVSACASTSEKQASTTTQQVANQKAPPSPTLASFCSDLENIPKNSDSDFIISHFDIQKFTDNIFTGINGKTKYFTDFKKNMLVSINSAPATLADILNNGQWKAIRYKENGNTARCMLRSYSTSTGILIIELHLYKKNNKIHISNWHDHIKNILTSEFVREIALDFKKIDDVIYSGLAKQDTPAIVNFKKLMHFANSASNNDQKASIEEFSALPPVYKNNPVYGLRMLAASKNSGDKLYIKAYQVFYRQFKNNKKFDLLYLDYFILLKEYDKALKTITDSEKRIGPDASLSLIKAYLYLKKGDRKKFYAMSLESINRDIAYENIYWVLFNEFIQQQQFKDAALVLDIMAKVFSYSFTRSRFETDPSYSEFIKTSHFNNWIDSL
ncbi:MAG TPA: hypothetical protein ENJ08_02480 [Gammaproteobacteria bacterium]|nr:hypothetical protein [Gammaproteobacteria bacterium]